MFTALLLRRKYVLWRCALVCERLRYEPWRPWGWGEFTALLLRRKYVLWRCAVVTFNAPSPLVATTALQTARAAASSLDVVAIVCCVAGKAAWRVAEAGGRWRVGAAWEGWRTAGA